MIHLMVSDENQLKDKTVPDHFYINVVINNRQVEPDSCVESQIIPEETEEKYRFRIDKINKHTEVKQTQNSRITILVCGTLWLVIIFMTIVYSIYHNQLVTMGILLITFVFSLFFIIFIHRECSKTNVPTL